MVDRTKLNHSFAVAALRASSRRVLHLIESEIGRQGGAATIYNDQLEMSGSRRVYLPALRELHALGLVDVVRLQRRHVCMPSNRWRGIGSLREATIIAGLAREARSAPRPVPAVEQVNHETTPQPTRMHPAP
jgi:hypothetical protein